MAVGSCRCKKQRKTAAQQLGELLLTAAPQAASLAESSGWRALHCAAASGHMAVLELVLSAAPETERHRTADSETGVFVAARYGQLSAARVLLERSTAALAELIANLLAAIHDPRAKPTAADTVHTLLADLAARTALAPADWAALPNPTPGLARALPAVLARSPAEAAQLVAHLPAAAQRRLRALALSLARLHRRLGLELPVHIDEQASLNIFQARLTQPASASGHERGLLLNSGANRSLLLEAGSLVAAKLFVETWEGLYKSFKVSCSETWSGDDADEAVLTRFLKQLGLDSSTYEVICQHLLMWAAEEAQAATAGAAAKGNGGKKAFEVYQQEVFEKPDTAPAATKLSIYEGRPLARLFGVPGLRPRLALHRPSTDLPNGSFVCDMCGTNPLKDNKYGDPSALRSHAYGKDHQAILGGYEMGVADALAALDAPEDSVPAVLLAELERLKEFEDLTISRRLSLVQQNRGTKRSAPTPAAGGRPPKQRASGAGSSSGSPETEAADSPAL
eukprot:scaffold23.g4121.t1